MKPGRGRYAHLDREEMRNIVDRRQDFCRPCHEFARAGDLEGLHRSRETGCPWDQMVGFCRHWYICALPAMAGDLVTLEWLRAQGCPEPYWREVVWHAAAKGRADVVSWACAQRLPMDELATLEAAGGGDLQMLQCLVAAGCPWDPEECQQAAGSRDCSEIVAWIEWWMSEGETKEPGEA